MDGANINMPDETITLKNIRLVDLDDIKTAASTDDIRDLKRDLSALFGNSVVIISEFVDTMETSKWSHHATLDGAQYFDNTDLSPMVKDDKTLKDNVYLMLTVHLTNNTYWPTTFEMTNQNNLDGFMVTLPAPKDGWVVGDNEVWAHQSTFSYPGQPNWKDQHRLELYLSEKNLAMSGDFITLKDVRLVDVDDLMHAGKTATKKSVDDIKIKMTELHSHTVMIMREFVDDVQTSKWSHHATLDKSYFDTTDISSMAESDTKLRSSVYLMLDVTLALPEHYPTTFELTNQNNLDGIMLQLQPLSGEWVVGKNRVVMPESSFGYKGQPNWNDQHRLELYLNGAEVTTSEKIIYSNIRFVDWNRNYDEL